ncbi:hypothetical protein BGZ81_005470 [Podila clonocystis]|nr:hypothetical protein BGZ81_005470 [Podila clonocystis]
METGQLRIPRAKILFSRFVLGLVAVCSLVRADDSYDAIYNDIGSLPCVRLLNATGAIGCQSMKAASGVLYRTDTDADIQQFATNKGLDSKYTVIMPYWLLTNPNIETLRSSKKLAAIIAVINGTDPTYSLSARPKTIISPDSTCPNCEFGLYANTPNQYQWNPSASGLLYRQYDFPIYALNTIDERNTMSYNAVMIAANINQNRGFSNYPLKALQFHSFMWGAQDSSACLRKGWCTPVGGASVWSTPSSNITATDSKPIIVVAASMDARSMFHDLTLGVESSVTGMVTLMAVAEALSRSTIPLDSMQKHILYTLFTGEAWGFGGSQRFVQDISKKIECIKPPTSGAGCTFPFFSNMDFQRLNPANIESIFEANQVGNIGSSAPTLYAHTVSSPSAATTALVQQLIQTGTTNVTAPEGTIAIKAANIDQVDRGLPPSSTMSFLKARAEIPAVVLTSFQKEMSPLTSQDLDDTWDPVVTVNSIQQAASAISKTVWLQAQGIQDAAQMTLPMKQSIGSIQVDQKLIQDLMYCLTRNYSCPLVDGYLNVTASANLPTRLPHYSGTLYSQSQPYPIFAWSFLANMTSVKNTTSTGTRTTGCSTRPDLVQCASGEYCVGNQCIATMTRYHDAFGVGISMNDKNEYFIEDPTKPTWTESTWDPIGLRLFEVTSPSSQIAELVTGVVVTVTSIGVVIWSRKFLEKTIKVA